MSLQTLITSTSSLTACADFFSAAFSSGVSVDLHDLPERPSQAELRRHAERRDPFTPYSPCRNTEHGRIFFLSLRMHSTISAAAAPGAHRARADSQSFAPPSAVRLDCVHASLRHQFRNRDAGHRRIARQRHHRVAVAAEHESCTFSTDTFSSIAMNVRMRAESRTPAMPMTRSLGKPLRR